MAGKRYSNGKKILNELQGEFQAYIDEAVSAGKYTSAEEVLCKALELLRNAEKTDPVSEKRQGGQWKGNVTFAPGFDDLPDDLTESFGMK